MDVPELSTLAVLFFMMQLVIEEAVISALPLPDEELFNIWQLLKDAEELTNASQLVLLIKMQLLKTVLVPISIPVWYCAIPVKVMLDIVVLLPRSSIAADEGAKITSVSVEGPVMLTLILL